MRTRIKKWLHDKLGWGFSGGVSGGDSFQPTYHCRFCSRTLLRDSNGDLFHSTNKESK